MIQNNIIFNSDDNLSEKDDSDQENGSKQNIEDFIPARLEREKKKTVVDKQIKFNTQISGGRSSFYFENGSNPIDVLSALTQIKLLSQRSVKNKSKMNQQQNNESLTLDDIIDLLQIQNEKKRPRDMKNQRKFFSGYKFFQNLIQQEGQEFTDQCIDNLVYKSFKKQQILFNSSLGEVEPDLRGIMILLKGQSRIFYQKECGLKYTVGQPCNFEEYSKLVEDGHTFGAYEFEQDNVRQNQKKIYSIICDTPCSFVFLDKQVFSQLKYKLINLQYKVQKVRKEKKDQIEFFKTISTFKKFEEMTLVELILQCEYETFSRKQYVYKEGDESRYVYFVHKGEFRLQVTKRTKTNHIYIQNKSECQQQDGNSKHSFNTNENQQDLGNQNNIFQCKSFEDEEDDDEYLNDVNKLDLREIQTLMIQKNKSENIQKQDDLTLIIYDQGAIFGDFEIINEIKNADKQNQIKKRKRLFSIQCMSEEGSCFKISNFRFRKLLNKRRLLLNTLIESNERLSQWITNRIGSVKSQKALTQNIQLNISIEKQQQEENNWLKEKEETQEQLAKQHTASTKYLESNLITLQSRLQKDNKERIHKVTEVAKEIKKLRDGRQQFLHNQLKEKTKKEQEIQKQNEILSPRKRNQPQLNLEDLISQVCNHSQSPRNRLLSRQSEKIDSCTSTPRHDDKSIDFDSFNNLAPDNNFSQSTVYQQQQRKNITRKEKSLFSEKIQNNFSTTAEQIQEQYFASSKKIVIPTRNMKSISSWSGKESPTIQRYGSYEQPVIEDDKKDLISQEYSEKDSIQKQYFFKKQDVKENVLKGENRRIHNNISESQTQIEGQKKQIYFIKKELQKQRFPQFYIQSSSPMSSQKKIQLKNNYFKKSTSNQFAQTDYSVNDNYQFFEQNSYENSQVESAFQKFKINSENSSQTNIPSKSEPSQDLNIKSSTSANMFWKKQSNKRSSVLLKQLVQENSKFQTTHRSLVDNIYQSLSINTKQSTQNYNQNTKNICKSPYMNQSQSIQKEENQYNFARPRSISNFDKSQSPYALQNEIKQRFFNQPNEIAKQDISLNIQKQEIKQSGQLQRNNNLPLKYFTPQSKTLKVSKGFVSHSHKQKPIKTESINLISPRQFAS